MCFLLTTTVDKEPWHISSSVRSSAEIGKTGTNAMGTSWLLSGHAVCKTTTATKKKDFEQFYLEGKYMVLSSKHKANTWRNVVFFFCFSLLKVSVHCTILALVEFTLQDQANSNPHPEAYIYIYVYTYLLFYIYFISKNTYLFLNVLIK